MAQFNVIIHWEYIVALSDIPCQPLRIIFNVELYHIDVTKFVK